MTRRFLALGDSYTVGEGVPGEQTWPSIVAARLRFPPPEVIARTGWTTEELDAAIDAAQPQGPFDLVTLLIGVNDQYRGRTAEGYRPAFVALLRRAIAFAGGEPRRVVVISIPDWSVTPFAEGRDRGAIASQIDRFNEVNRDEARRAGARRADVTPLSRQVPLTAADGLHPAAEAYARWAEIIVPVAQAALSDS